MLPRNRQAGSWKHLAESKRLPNIGRAQLRVDSIPPALVSEIRLFVCQFDLLPCHARRELHI